MNLYTGNYNDVEVLPNGNLLAVDNYNLYVLGPGGGRVPQIGSPYLYDLRGVEYSARENAYYASMLGTSSTGFWIWKLDATTGQPLAHVDYWYADDLWVTPDSVLVAGSTAQVPGTFSHDLTPLGRFAGPTRNFVTQYLVSRNLTWNKTDGVWDMQTANQPWVDSATPASFLANDNAQFASEFGGTITVNASGVIANRITVANANGTYTFAGGPIDGTLSKTASGSVVLESANWFSGVSISGGVLETRLSGALSNGPVTISNGATWRVSNSAQTYSNAVTLGSGGGTIDVMAPRLTLSRAIDGNGTLTKTGSGILELTGTQPLLGPVTVAGGTLQGDTVNLPLTTTLTDNSNVTFHQTRDDVFNGVVTGTGSLTKTGSGVLTITSSQSYSGATKIDAGTVRLSAPIAPPGAVVWFDASTLNLTNGATVGGLTDLGTSHNNAVATGSPRFTRNGLGGKGTINFNGDQGLSTQSNLGIAGGTSRSMFVVMRRNGDSSSGSIAVQLGSGVSYNGWGVTSQPDWFGTYVIGQGGAQGTPQPAGVFGLYSAMHQDGNPVLGGSNYLYVNGALTATGSNTPDVYTVNGPLAIGKGPICPSANGDFAELLIYNTFFNEVQRRQVEAYLNYKWFGIGTTNNLLPVNTALTVAEGSIFDLNSLTQTIASLEGRGSVTLGSGTLTVNSTVSSTYSGTISGSGSFVKRGDAALILDGANTFTGATTINAGPLTVNGSLDSPAVDVNEGASLGGTGSLAGKVTVAGGNIASAQGSVSLVDGVIGSLTLSDPNSSDTALTLGGMSAGTPAIMDFEVGETADNILLSMARLMVNAGGATINITPLDDFHAGVYDLINFNAGQATGLDRLSLSTTTLPGYTLSLQSTPTAEQLVVSAVPEPSTLGLIGAGVGCLLVYARQRREEQP